MTNIEKLLEMLTSGNPNKRYEASELMRVAPSIPEEALAALRKATSDPNPEVADVATRALSVHTAEPGNAQPPGAVASVRADPLAIWALALALIGAPYWLGWVCGLFSTFGDITGWQGLQSSALLLWRIASLLPLSALVLGVVSLARIRQQTPRLGGSGYAWVAIALAAPQTICMLLLSALLPTL